MSALKLSLFWASTRHWRCAVVLYQFSFFLKKQGSKTIKITREILKTQCASVCLFMPAHTTMKNKTHFFILWQWTRAASAQCSMHRSLSFSTHPYTHTHTHTYMLTNKHENICTPQIQNGMQVAQSPLVLHSTSTVEMGSSGTTTKRLLKMTAWAAKQS